MAWNYPNTKSDSSAKVTEKEGAEPNNMTARIAHPGTVSGEGSIGVTKSVKYKQYSGSNRVNEDYALDKNKDEQTQDFDGVRTAMPQGEPKKSFINTNAVK